MVFCVFTSVGLKFYHRGTEEDTGVGGECSHMCRSATVCTAVPRMGLPTCTPFLRLPPGTGKQAMRRVSQRAKCQ
jgi:hypothetical protein